MEIFMADNAVVINLPGLHDGIKGERNLLDGSGQGDDDSGSLSTAVFLVALSLISLVFCGCFLINSCSRDRQHEALMVSSRTPEQIRRAAKKSRHIFVKSNLKVKAFTLEMLKQSNEQTQAAGTNETNHNEEKVWIENQCVVCFNEFENGDEIGWSESCDHIFHRDCIYAWLLKHPECRCCRRNFFNISDKGEEKRSSHAETEDVDMEMGNMRTHRDSGEEIPPSPNNNSLSTAYVAEVLDSTG